MMGEVSLETSLSLFRADYISGFLRIFAYLKNENGYQKAYNNDISDFL